MRGENCIDVLDGHTYREKTRTISPPVPGLTICLPNGECAYVCNSFNLVTDAISIADHKIIATAKHVIHCRQRAAAKS